MKMNTKTPIFCLQLVSKTCIFGSNESAYCLTSSIGTFDSKSILLAIMNLAKI